MERANTVLGVAFPLSPGERANNRKHLLHPQKSVGQGSGYFNNSIKGGTENSRPDMQNDGFLVDNIFLKFDGNRFRQVIGIPMGTNCAPLLG